MDTVIDISNITEEKEDKKEKKKTTKTKELITEEEVKITRAQLADIFQNCTSRNITIKNLTIGTKLNADKTIESFAKKANIFLQMVVKEVNRKYTEKMEYLETKTLPGMLSDLANLIKINGWKLRFTDDNYLVAEKIYSPPKGLIEATQNGNLNIYESEFCKIGKMTIYLDSSKLTRVDLDIPEGRHPNINTMSACLGDLRQTPINFHNPTEVAELIYNVEKTYLLPSLDSSYTQPSISLKEQKPMEVIWNV